MQQGHTNSFERPVDQKEPPTLPDDVFEPEAEWHNHVIVCGLHTLGFRVMAQLHAAGIAVVVIAENSEPELVKQARHLQIALIEGDSRNRTTLLQAAIKHASALIACEATDLVNLQIVLTARQLVPKLRIVVNFADQNLGSELRQAVNKLKVLSVAHKAEPSFTEACLSSNVLDFFSLADFEMAVVEAKITRSGSLKQLFHSGAGLPLFLRQPPANIGTGPFSATPELDAPPPPNSACYKAINRSQDYTLQSGQYLTIAGRLEDLLRFPGVELNEKEVLAARTRHRRSDVSYVSSSSRSNSFQRSPFRFVGQLRALLAGLVAEIERPFRYAFLFVGIIVVISTLLLWQFYRTSFTNPAGQPIDFTLLDSLYFTITIITSVGFGDYNFAQQDWGLKIFGIFLILVGVASTSVLYAFVANFIISRRLAQTLGRQQATELRNHVILCGLGTMGHEVMQSLWHQGVPVVVVEKDEQDPYKLEARRLGIPVIYGDAKQLQSLRAANIRHARVLAALTGDDLTNLKTVLSARAEFASYPVNHAKQLKIVLRLFDNNLAEMVAETFGIQTSYSASELAAPYFVGGALNYEVLSTFYQQRQLFIVAQLIIEAATQLSKMTLQQVYDNTGLGVLALTSSGPTNQAGSTSAFLGSQKANPLQFYPELNTPLKAADSLYVIGTSSQMATAYRLNLTQPG